MTAIIHGFGLLGRLGLVLILGMVFWVREWLRD